MSLYFINLFLVVLTVGGAAIVRLLQLSPSFDDWVATAAAAAVAEPDMIVFLVVAVLVSAGRLECCSFTVLASSRFFTSFSTSTI